MKESLRSIPSNRLNFTYFSSGTAVALSNGSPNPHKRTYARQGTNSSPEIVVQEEVGNSYQTKYLYKPNQEFAITQVTLPTGGTVNYQYNNGVLTQRQTLDAVTGNSETIGFYETDNGSTLSRVLITPITKYRYTVMKSAVEENNIDALLGTVDPAQGKLIRFEQFKSIGSINAIFRYHQYYPTTQHGRSAHLISSNFPRSHTVLRFFTRGILK